MATACDGMDPRDRSPSLARWRPGGTAGLACAAALFLVSRFAFKNAFHLPFYQRDARMNAAAAADAHVPDGVTVQAVDHLGPHLPARDTVLLWDGDGSSTLFPPWVVADVAERDFAALAQQVRRVALLERSGYRAVSSGEGTSCCTVVTLSRAPALLGRPPDERRG